MLNLEITEYKVELPKDLPEAYKGTLLATESIYIVRTKYGEDQWKVYRKGQICLNKDGDWEWESLPSERSDEFLERTRYTLEEATEAIVKLFARWKGEG